MSADEKSFAELLRTRQLGLPFRWRLVLIGAGVVVLMAVILLSGALLTKFERGIDVTVSLGRIEVLRLVLSGGLVGLGMVVVPELWGHINPRMVYWRRLPKRGQVALERLVFRGAFAFWVPDPGFAVAGARPKGISDWASPRVQMVLARTEQGWWIRPDHVPREWDGRPALWRALARDVAIAYAPRTDITLGIRVEGPEIPVTATDIELAADDIDVLRRAARTPQGHALPSGQVTRPEDVQAVDALLRARLGDATDLHAGPTG